MGKFEKLYIRDLSEFALIEILRSVVEDSSNSDEIILNNGDDCFAFIPKDKILVSTDSMVEKVHFNLKNFSAYHVGVKSVVSNISDIASCGGIPKFILVSLILPKNLPISWLINLYKGIKDTTDKYYTKVVGGNISRGDRVSITITVLGETDKPISRTGAREGDLIFCTGTLGDSSKGLEIILNGRKLNKLNECESFFVMRHLEPLARVEVGREIRNIATSCIDVSDGFLQDLSHILRMSGVGADVFLEKIPISEAYEKYIGKSVDKLFYALNGGEDYELIFTIPREFEREVLDIAKKLNVRITNVGEIISEKKIQTFYQGKLVEINPRGWRHF